MEHWVEIFVVVLAVAKYGGNGEGHIERNHGNNVTLSKRMWSHRARGRAAEKGRKGLRLFTRWRHVGKTFQIGRLGWMGVIPDSDLA